MGASDADVVRRVYDEVLAREAWLEPATFERLPELFDPEVELQQLEGLLGTSGTYHGYEGLRQAAAELVGAIKDMDWVVEDLREVGDRVVTAVRVDAVGRGSGVPVSTRVGHLWELVGGRVVRWVVYETPEAALEAARSAT